MRRAGLLIAGVFLATGAGFAFSSPASAAGTSGGSTTAASTARHDHPNCDGWGNGYHDDWGNGFNDDWGNSYNDGCRYWHHRRHHHHWHTWDNGGDGPWTVRG
jgi:hypothetical protein